MSHTDRVFLQLNLAADMDRLVKKKMLHESYDFLVITLNKGDGWGNCS